MRCSSVKSSGVKTSSGSAVLDQEAAAAGGDDRGPVVSVAIAYILSKMPAAPMPPPTHIVTSP